MNSGGLKALSSRVLARSWPYPRRVQFQREMRQTAANYLAEKGWPVDTRYDFILAEWSDWPRNIILPEVVEYIKHVRRVRESKGEGFALHKYIHHGLSSQAMLFNLIGPLIVRRDHNWAENSTLAELRDTLLPKLISGELPVSEAEKLAEVVL